MESIHITERLSDRPIRNIFIESEKFFKKKGEEGRLYSKSINQREIHLYDSLKELTTLPEYNKQYKNLYDARFRYQDEHLYYMNNYENRAVIAFNIKFLGMAVRKELPCYQSWPLGYRSGEAGCWDDDCNCDKRQPILRLYRKSMSNSVTPVLAYSVYPLSYDQIMFLNVTPSSYNCLDSYYKE